jgi:dynactin-5
MLGGRTVIMAGVTMRGDLQRKPDASESGDKTASTAITIGRYERQQRNLPQLATPS